MILPIPSFKAPTNAYSISLVGFGVIFLRDCANTANGNQVSETLRRMAVKIILVDASSSSYDGAYLNYPVRPPARLFDASPIKSYANNSMNSLYGPLVTSISLFFNPLGPPLSHQTQPVPINVSTWALAMVTWVFDHPLSHAAPTQHHNIYIRFSASKYALTSPIYQISHP
jgi:hypothetical protein